MASDFDCCRNFYASMGLKNGLLFIGLGRERSVPGDEKIYIFSVKRNEASSANLHADHGQ